MGGEIAAKNLQGKGNVVVFTIPEQDNLKQRLNGYQAAFSNHPQIKIIEIIDVKGDPRIAFDKTTEILEKRAAAVNAFVCLEATACPEVAEVMNRKGVKDKVVVAMDTDRGTLEWIQKGTIAATIGQKPFTMGYYGLKMLDDLHHHKPPSLDRNWAQDSFSPLPTFVDTGTVLVDRSNAASFTSTPPQK
jgi:ribose transport system substrate-binding protein